jgi:WD40 repeat protein
MTLESEATAGSIILRNLSTGKVEWEIDLRHPRNKANSSDGRLLAEVSSVNSKLVEIRELSTLRVVQRLQGHPGKIVAIAVSPSGGELITASGDGSVSVRNSKSGELIRSWQVSDEPMQALALSADGRLVAAASTHDGAVRVWEVTTGTVRHVFRGHLDLWSVNAIAFLPDSTGLVSGGGNGDRTIRLWSLVTGAAIGTIEVPGDRFSGDMRTCCGSAVAALVASPSGRRVAVTTVDGYLYWLDPSSRRLDQIRPGFATSRAVAAVSFRGDADWEWILAGEHFVRMRSREGAVHVAPFVVDTASDSVSGIAIDAQLMRIALGTVDGTIRVVDWDGRLLREWRSTDSVVALSFSPDGRVLFAGGDDQNIQAWDIMSGNRLWSADQAR